MVRNRDDHQIYYFAEKFKAKHIAFVNICSRLPKIVNAFLIDSFDSAAAWLPWPGCISPVVSSSPL